MMSRVLKRPMFKMGGDVENVGIMDGMRKRYSEAGRVEDYDETYNAADCLLYTSPSPRDS